MYEVLIVVGVGVMDEKRRCFGLGIKNKDDEGRDISVRVEFKEEQGGDVMEKIGGIKIEGS